MERQVRDVVLQFVDRLRIGEPLLFTQLTREVLNVKEVNDLPDSAWPPSGRSLQGRRPPPANRARWASRTSPPAGQLEEDLTLPMRLVLRTRRGTAVRGDAGGALPEGRRRVTRASAPSATGATASCSAPAPPSTGNRSRWTRPPEDLQRRPGPPHTPHLPPRREADRRRPGGTLRPRSREGRLEEKPLAVHVLVEVSFPDAPIGRARRVDPHAGRRARAGSRNAGDPGLELDEAARNGARDAIQEFLARTSAGSRRPPGAPLRGAGRGVSTRRCWRR